MRYQRRRSRAAIWALRFAVFATALLLLSVMGHRFGAIQTPELVPLGVVIIGLSLLALLLAAVGFVSLWQNGDKGGARSFWAGMLAVCVLLPFGLLGWQYETSPSIYDVSTDFDTPPQFPAALRARQSGQPPNQSGQPSQFGLPKMNPLSLTVPDDALIQLSTYPDVVGKSFAASPDRLLQVVDKLLKTYGWQKTGQAGVIGDDSETTITARAKSPILGLESDVAIRLIDEDEATYVDMRSVSLYGSNDMGLNAGYIVGFMAELDREMSAAPADVE